MFGFLRPPEQTLRYRSVYARCCQHLRRHYGLRSAPFHSYEAVFFSPAPWTRACIPKMSSSSEGVADSLPLANCVGAR